jgi:hypothetical protein
VSGQGEDKILIGRESWYLDRSVCERELRSEAPAVSH